MRLRSLLKGEKGKKGAWEQVYNWLETKKFPRWRTPYIWQQWRERSRANINWIGFHPNQQEPVPIWDDDRLYQLWLEWEQQPDRGVYYQSFDVVDSPVGLVIPQG
jgi:hypothetical protein